MRYLSIYLLLFTQLCFSQSIQGIGNAGSYITPAQMGKSSIEVAIEGSPYTNELYSKGVTIINGKKTREALMRYNAVNEVIEILDENGDAKIILRRKNISAEFDNKIYIVDEYLENGKTKLGYFNPLNKGNTTLYLKPKKIFVQANNPENGYDDFEPAAYKTIDTYYLKKKGEKAVAVKLTKRAILKTLKSHQDQLKQYITKQRLNLQKEKDVLRLLTYFDELSSNKTPN